MSKGDLVRCIDPQSCMRGEIGWVIAVGNGYVTVHWRAIGTIGRVKVRLLALAPKDSDNDG